MLIEIIRILFPKTYDHIYNTGVTYGEVKERLRAIEDRANIHRFTQEQWIGKKVIIISNEWKDPFIGMVIGLEDFERNEAHLVVENGLTHEIVIHFGKVLPFSIENLKAVVQMNPWVRWEILTGQKLGDEIPDMALKSFDQFIQELGECGFLTEQQQ